MRDQSLVILLAEDDPGHAYLVRQNLTRAGVANELVHVADGQQALDFVQCRGQFADRDCHLPVLMLLDINMPKLSGIDVLTAIKADPATANTPAIMLTTTDDPREIQRCYEQGCNAYVVKPVVYESFVDAVRRLGLFLQIVRLPERECVSRGARGLAAHAT